MGILVLDAYAPEGRAALSGAGGTEAGPLYRALLRRLEPAVRVDIACPADGEIALPAGVTISSYAGVVWTGSSLTIHDAEDARVRRQIELARAIAQQGVPSFGSCWAAQIATVAAGGECAAHPKGREFGIARGVSLNEEGRAHPLYRGKPEGFDALTSHADHIVSLAPGSRHLAGNAWSEVQALTTESGRHRFWAVQYHPEYDLHEVASLARLRMQELVDQGSFTDAEAGQRWIEDLEALHQDPTRHDLSTRLGLDRSVLDESIRTAEVRNWLDSLL